MDNVPNSTLRKIAQRAGIQRVDHDCYPIMRQLLSARLDNIMAVIFAIRESRATKTITQDIVNSALVSLGYSVLPEDVTGSYTLVRDIPDEDDSISEDSGNTV